MPPKSERDLKNVISWAKWSQMVKGDNTTGASAAFFFRNGRVDVTPEGKLRSDKFTLDDVIAVSLTEPSGETVRVSSGARAAGGAVAGGILLGPAGLIAGAVVGHAAKRTVAGHHVLDIVRTDGTKYTLLVKPGSVQIATKIVEEIAAQLDA